MCIIALKPAKIILSKPQIKTMWDNNPDGAGFMYADGGKVHIVKGLMTLDALWDAMEAVGPSRKLVIHFRIRTHGAKSAELTHPFYVQQDKLGMVHNGVIRPLVNETSDTDSDTSVFARKLGQAYSNPLTAIRNPFHRDMLEAYIGFSKVVFMDKNGATHILNEHMGEWKDNVWYSNDRYKETKYSTYGSYVANANYGGYKGYSAGGVTRGGDDNTPPYGVRLPGSSTVPQTSSFPVGGKDSKAKGSGGTKGGSENARGAVQKALMGMGGTDGKANSWDRLPFPEEAARRMGISKTG